MPILSKDTQAALLSGTAIIGFLLALFPFGVFMRMFYYLMAKGNFMIPYIILLVIGAIIGMAVISFFPYHNPHSKAWITLINWGLALYFYLFIWNMPEANAGFDNDAFDAWVPFQVGGNRIFLYCYLILNVFNLLWQFGLLRHIYHFTANLKTHPGSSPELATTESSARLPYLTGLISVGFLLLLFALDYVILMPPKFYFELNIAWIVLETIAIMPFESIAGVKPAPSLTKVSNPGWFTLFLSTFLMFFMTIVVYATEPYNTGNLMSLADLQPWIFLGIAISLGLMWGLERFGVKSLMMKYWLLFIGFTVFWGLIRATANLVEKNLDNYPAMGATGVQVLMGMIFGLVFSIFWEFEWPRVPATKRRGRDLVQILFIGIILIITHSLKIYGKFWIPFFYMAAGTIVLGVIMGILAIIFNKKSATRSSSESK